MDELANATIEGDYDPTQVENVPVDVKLYGPSVGEHSRDQLYGPLGNQLEQGDVAVSPDLLPHHPLGSTINLNGNDYRVADTSWVKPGVPNHNTVEIWNAPKDTPNRGVVRRPVGLAQAAGDQAFASTRLPQLSNAEITPGLSGARIAGLNKLTPIGSGQGEIDASGEEESGLSPEELQSVAENQGQQQQDENIGSIPMPSSAATAKPTAVNPDGSVQFGENYKVYPESGRVEFNLHGNTFVKTNPYSKMVRVPPAQRPFLKQDPDTKQWIDFSDPKNPQIVPTPQQELNIPENATGRDALIGLSKRDQEFVKDYADYKLPPPSAGLSRNPTFVRLLPYITAYNPDWRASEYGAQQQVVKQFSSTATGSAGYNINSINTAMDHLGSLWDKAQALDNSKLKKYNSIANYVKNETGDPKVVAFNDERTRVATELARAFTGGVPTDVQIKEAQASLDNANSPAQLKAVIQGTIPEMLNARMGELNTAYQRTMGKAYPAIISPRAQNVLNRFGIKDFGGINDTTTNQSPSAQFDPDKVYVDSNGNRAKFVNGKWQAIP